jgi:SAM-dependent methyltransferase
MRLMGQLANAVRLATALIDREKRAHLQRALTAYDATPAAECPCCRHQGKFASFGIANRPGAMCPECGALERHRLLALALQSGFFSVEAQNVLHFAPERVVCDFLRSSRPASYRSADLAPGAADLVMNIENIDLADASVDLVVCLHVLEHVDDTKALAQMHRILRPGGAAVLMVPLIEGWDETYENNLITGEADRLLHFGQKDHVRHFGSDFRARLTGADFTVKEFTASPEQCVRFSLSRGEKVFLGLKRPSHDQPTWS